MPNLLLYERCGMRWVHLALFVLVAAAFSSFAFTAIDLWHKVGGASLRYTLYGYPIAIGAIKTGVYDYTAPWEVAAQFVFHPERLFAQSAAEAMAVNVTLPDERWFVSGDDTGMVDIAFLAFKLFGVNDYAVIDFILLLVGLSAAIYIIKFRHNYGAIVLLFALLCGQYAVAFTFGITDQSRDITEPRFIGAVSIIATVHLIMAVWGRRLTIELLVTSFLQAIILFIALHVRTSEVWQVCLVIVAALLSVVIQGNFRRPLAVISIVSLVAIGLTTWKSCSYNHKYFTDNVPQRVLWHNAVMGLALNKSIAQHYQISVLSDVSVMEAVRKFMPSGARDEVFFNEHYADANFRGFSWAKYEQSARALYLHIITEEPYEVLFTYSYLAPRVAVKTIWYMVHGGSPENWAALEGHWESQEVRNKFNLYLSIFRPMTLFGVFLCGALISFVGGKISYKLIFLPALLCAASTITWILVLPVVHYMQVSAMLAVTAVCLVCIKVIAYCFSIAIRLIAQHSS